MPPPQRRRLEGTADVHCAIAVEEIATQDAVPVGRSIAWP
jgi:hypothetical protein